MHTHLSAGPLTLNLNTSSKGGSVGGKTRINPCDVSSSASLNPTFRRTLLELFRHVALMSTLDCTTSSRFSTKTLILMFPRGPGRLTAMWEFSNCAEEACCANSLSPPKQNKLQSILHAQSSSCIFTNAAPKKMCAWAHRCVEVSGKITPSSENCFTLVLNLLHTVSKFLPQFVYIPSFKSCFVI